MDWLGYKESDEMNDSTIVHIETQLKHIFLEPNTCHSETGDSGKEKSIESWDKSVLGINKDPIKLKQYVD